MECSRGVRRTIGHGIINLKERMPFAQTADWIEAFCLSLTLERQIKVGEGEMLWILTTINEAVQRRRKPTTGVWRLIFYKQTHLRRGDLGEFCANSTTIRKTHLIFFEQILFKIHHKTENLTVEIWIHAFVFTTLTAVYVLTDLSNSPHWNDIYGEKFTTNSMTLVCALKRFSPRLVTDGRQFHFYKETFIRKNV